MVTIFMTFIELVLSDGLVEMLPPFEQNNWVKSQNLANFRVFYVAGANAEISLVEPEVVIRRFQLKAGGFIAVGNAVVVIEQRDIIDELTVDEDLRAGKRLKFD